jgi:hypothetical protein
MLAAMEDKPILLRNAAEASLLEALLTEEGIPHFLKAYGGPAFDGLLTYKDSWGHVDCAPEHKPRIVEILSELRTTRPGT